MINAIHKGLFSVPEDILEIFSVSGDIYCARSRLQRTRGEQIGLKDSRKL